MSTQPCPLPYAVTRHGDADATVTPCDRWAGHGGRCAPPEPEPVTVGCDVATDGTAGVVIYHAHGHVPRTDRPWYDLLPKDEHVTFTEPTEERTINEQRTLIGLPPLPAESDWFRVPVETDTSVPVSHFQIKQDGTVLATVPFGNAEATFLAFDPGHPYVAPHTTAAPGVIQDAIARYAEKNGIEMHADAEWKARRDAANERIRERDAEPDVKRTADGRVCTCPGICYPHRTMGETSAEWATRQAAKIVADRESNLHPNPTFETTVGWTTPESLAEAFTFQTEYLNADLIRHVYGWHGPRHRAEPPPRDETLADAAVSMLASRRPTVYRPQARELAPTPSWIRADASLAVVTEIVDRILGKWYWPPRSHDLRKAAQAALLGRPRPPRNIKTLAEHMNFTRGAIEHDYQPRLTDLLNNAIAKGTWETGLPPSRDQMLNNLRIAAEHNTYEQTPMHPNVYADLIGHHHRQIAASARATAAARVGHR